MKFVLKPSIAVNIRRVSPEVTEASFLFDGGTKELVLKLDEPSLSVVNRLRSVGVDPNDENLTVFLDRNMLIEDYVLKELSNESQFLHRQKLFLIDAISNQKTLNHALKMIGSARIGIVGLGGIGSNIYSNLVRMGFSKFILVDPDRVDASNLNRQVIYSWKDIGRRKIDSAEEYARSISNQISINKVMLRTGELNGELNECDIVINCSDVPDVYSTTSEILRNNKKIPSICIGGGYYCRTSFAGPCILSCEIELIEKFRYDRAGFGKHIRAIGGNTASTAILPATVMAQHVLNYFISDTDGSRVKLPLYRKMWVFDWNKLVSKFVDF